MLCKEIEKAVGDVLGLKIGARRSCQMAVDVRNQLLKAYGRVAIS